MNTKKTAKKKAGPGRGGRRTGAGRKAIEGSRRALLSVRVTEEAKQRVEDASFARGVTPGELVQEWAETLLVVPA